MVPEWDVFLLGVNHRTAPVEVREHLVYRKEDLAESLQNLCNEEGIEEAVILSTCNRTEIYVVCSRGVDGKKILKEFLQKRNFSCDQALYSFQMEGAIRHLFRVSCGLDSMILGETQILGQLKDAFAQACSARTVGSVFQKLFHLAITTGKKVQTETRLNHGAMSVAYAAVELAEKIFKDLSKHKALLIGAGETGELAAQYLKKRGIQELYIANRTLERAEKLAKTLGGKAFSCLELPDLLSQVTIVIGAASVENYLVGEKELEPAFSRFPGRSMLFIDLGMPRNFNPELEKRDFVFLHHLDNLEQIMEKNKEKRKDQIPLAESIIQKGVEQFFAWQRCLKVQPTVVALQEKLEKIRKVEIEKYRHQFSEKEWDLLERATSGIMGKILHFPLIQLKKYGNDSSDGLARVDVVREIFNLEIEDDVPAQSGQ